MTKKTNKKTRTEFTQEAAAEGGSAEGHCHLLEVHGTYSKVIWRPDDAQSWHPDTDVMTLLSDAQATISSSNSSSMARICHISCFSYMLFKALTFKLFFIRSASTLEVVNLWQTDKSRPATHAFVGKGWTGSYINSHISTYICTYCTSFFNTVHSLWNSYEVASKYLLQGWMCCAPSDRMLLVNFRWVEGHGGSAGASPSCYWAKAG